MPGDFRQPWGDAITRVVSLLAFILGQASFSQAQGFAGISMGGPTGMILCPSPSLVSGSWYGVGLHRGSMKASFGLFDLGEAGVKLPDLFDRPDNDAWGTLSTGHAKIALQGPGGAWSWLPSAGIGAENSPDRSQETYYATWSWRADVSQWPMELLLGYGTGRFLNNPFCGVSLMPYTYLGHSLKLIAEYAGEKAETGVRFALSRTLRLDFAVLLDAQTTESDGSHRYTLRIDRAILGASQTGQVKPERLFLFLKKHPKDTSIAEPPSR